MNRITSFKHENRVIPLIIPGETDNYYNTFTVIVGKNGVGKSRLISNMVNEFVRVDKYSSPYELNNEFAIIDEDEPRVIAVSTSPFDKFKLPPRKRKFNDFIVKTNYRYVGMRSGGPYGASAISLISSATIGILDRFIKKGNYDRLRDVFNTLGFLPEVQLIFKLNFTFNRNRMINELENSDRGYQELKWLNDLGIEITPRSIESLLETNERDKWKIRKALDDLQEVFVYEKAISIGLDFTHGEVFSLNRNTYQNIDLLDSLNTLLNFNLIRLMDMKLHKHEYGSMSLRRASSGEQCMLVIMLGIAGNITDNSLIFIDEPEISLHPRWQEEFMSLLVKTFSKYRACQFFIATHSPQIVSKLSNKNCFVTSMTKNEIFPSSFFYNMSSDFQLAELFDAPGSKNEYITRLAFSLLSKVKRKRAVSIEDIERLDKLLLMSELIDKNDPTLDLIKSIEEVVKHYASN